MAESGLSAELEMQLRRLRKRLSDLAIIVGVQEDEVPGKLEEKVRELK